MDISRMVWLIWGSLINELDSFMMSVDFCNAPVTFKRASSVSARASEMGSWMLTQLLRQLVADRAQAGLADGKPVLLLVASDHFPCQYAGRLYITLVCQLLHGLPRFVRGNIKL